MNANNTKDQIRVDLTYLRTKISYFFLASNIPKELWTTTMSNIVWVRILSHHVNKRPACLQDASQVAQTHGYTRLQAKNWRCPLEGEQILPKFLPPHIYPTATTTMMHTWKWPNITASQLSSAELSKPRNDPGGKTLVSRLRILGSS